MQPSPAARSPVLAYAVESPLKMDDNSVYTNSDYQPGGSFIDDTNDMSGNFFSQLDSMIAAVKVESSAFDSMKEKLKEVEGLRTQIQAFTKRLLDADQQNINLKTNLLKAQEAFADLKKSKAESDAAIGPIRNEMAKIKDMYQKERVARLSAQQEIAMLKDQIMRLENINENLNSDVKTIAPLQGENDMLKSDLNKLRKVMQQEKLSSAKQIKHLEAQAQQVESVKGEVRQLALRLLDVASSNGKTGGGGGGGNVNSNLKGGNSTYSSNSSQQHQMYQQQQQQQQQRYAPQQKNIHYETDNQSIGDETVSSGGDLVGDDYDGQYANDFEHDMDSDFDGGSIVDDASINYTNGPAPTHIQEATAQKQIIQQQPARMAKSHSSTQVVANQQGQDKPRKKKSSTRNSNSMQALQSSSANGAQMYQNNNGGGGGGGQYQQQNGSVQYQHQQQGGAYLPRIG